MKKPTNNQSDQTECTEETALAFFARQLDELNWKYHRYPDKPVFYSGFNGNHVQWDFSLYARQTDPGLFLLGVNSFIPNRTPEGLRQACAELLTRINFELVVGCFELNLADGEIRFRTSALVPAADITPGIVENLLRLNLRTVDERYPQIMAVLYAGATPEDALQPKEKKAEATAEPRFDFN